MTSIELDPEEFPLILETLDNNMELKSIHFRFSYQITIITLRMYLKDKKGQPVWESVRHHFDSIAKIRLLS